MDNLQFYSYSKSAINQTDISIVQRLYLPIIGPTAQALYIEINNLAFNSRSYVNNIGNNVSSLMKSLHIESSEFLKARKTLEAVGLLKTFLSNDEKRLSFELLAPLSMVKFMNNKLLKNLLLNQIGEIRLSNLFHLYKEVKVDLDDYTEISSEFTDLFDISELNKDPLELTQEMELPVMRSVDEAIEKLSSILFFQYLTQRFPSTTETLKIKGLLKTGMPNSSLNLILNYSYVKNGAIIFNYINAIVKDFDAKNVDTFIKIKDSLKFSIAFSENNFFNNEEDDAPAREKTVNDIFKGMFSN